jgi:activator of 2-hydroxyglutaryl-CoA dehydratase
MFGSLVIWSLEFVYWNLEITLMSQTVGLGIDVGGTNTDAVLIDLGERRLLSFAKAPTTKMILRKDQRCPEAARQGLFSKN